MSDLKTLADRVEARPFVLMGMSFMGIVAIRYAAEHPERVRALVLWDYGDFSARPVTLMEIASKDWPFFIETTARTGWPQFAPALVKGVLWDAMTQSDHVAQGRALLESSGEALLRRVTVPTLLLATRMGTRPGSAEDENKRWAALLPNAQLALLDDAESGGTSRFDGSLPEVLLRIEEFLSELQGTNKGEGLGLTSAGPLELTQREVEVLRLLAQGKSNPEIAKELFITRNTVQNHVSSILTKTNLQNRAQAAVYAKEHGFV